MISVFDDLKSQSTRMGLGKLHTKFGGNWKRGGEAKKFVYISFRKYKTSGALRAPAVRERFALTHFCFVRDLRHGPSTTVGP